MAYVPAGLTANLDGAGVGGTRERAARGGSFALEVSLLNEMRGSMNKHRKRTTPAPWVRVSF